MRRLLICSASLLLSCTAAPPGGTREGPAPLSDAARAPVAAQVCPRPAEGSLARTPPSISSHHGVLRTSFSYRSQQDDQGRTLYCYVTPDGLQNPTLRLHPGDRLHLTVKNELTESHQMEMVIPGPHCASASMTASSMNVHYHGTNTSPTCGQDEVLRTVINAGESFTYDLNIPADEPPGLYWYHPHIHGIAEAAVLGGASGALVIEGLERVQPLVAGLREQLLVLRDQTVAGSPAPGGPVPSWDVTVNQVPVSYPSLRPALLELRRGERQLLRAVNAGADTILDLQVRYDGVAQPLHVVALDGVPTGSQDGTRRGRVVKRDHVLLPPGARAEWILDGPFAPVQKAELVTLAVDTGPAGDSDPERTLATFQLTGGRGAGHGSGLTEAQAQAELPQLPEFAAEPGPQRFEGLAEARPVTTRTVYFSEVISDPSNPLSPTNFYITEQGATPQLFDPQNGPAITTHQGAVEDWIIENRATENHVFHIHQIHFLLLEKDGVRVPEADRQYLDLIQLPYWDGSGPYPSVKVRMDFRGPDVGDFVYHCHILGHEDNGMMAIIRVLPPERGGR